MTAYHKIIFYIYQIVVIYSIPGGKAIMWYPFRISVLAFAVICWRYPIKWNRSDSWDLHYISHIDLFVCVWQDT